MEDGSCIKIKTQLRLSGLWTLGSGVILIFILTAGLAPPALAQSAADSAEARSAGELEPGDVLRIRSATFSGRASYLNHGADTLRAHSRLTGRRLALPVDALRSVEWQRSVPRTRRFFEGAKWGALVGAGIGTMGLVMSERGPGDPPRAIWPFYGAAYFALPTGIVSAAIPRREWVPVLFVSSEKEPRRTARLRIRPTGLAFRLRW